jgi:hypothetical protein
MVDSVTPIKKVDPPICVECKSFRPTTSIGDSAYCVSQTRESDFDPVYGRSRSCVNAYKAREDIYDCGPTGKWFEAKPPESTIDEKHDTYMAKKYAMMKKETLWHRILNYLDGPL